MKNKVLTAILSASMVFGGVSVVSVPAQAVVPVFDSQSFIRQWQQLLEARNQLAQAKKTYEQFRGNRDIGKLFNQYGKFMPAEMQAMYKDYQSGNWAGLADKVAKLENSQKLTGKQKDMLEQMIKRERSATFEHAVKLDDMFARSNERFEQIERLANSIDLQKDPKAAADLLNRIQVENALLQLQTNQLQMVNMMRQAERDLVREQQLKYAREFSHVGGKEVQRW